MMDKGQKGGREMLEINLLGDPLERLTAKTNGYLSAAMSFNGRANLVMHLLELAATVAQRIDDMGAELEQAGYAKGGFRTKFQTAYADENGPPKVNPITFEVAYAGEEPLFTVDLNYGGKFKAYFINGADPTPVVIIGERNAADFLKAFSSCIWDYVRDLGFVENKVTVKDGKLKFTEPKP